MKSLTLILIAIASATSARAQSWSPQEKEVLDHINKCWDAFLKKDFENWVSVCRPTPDYTVWRPGVGAPLTMDDLRKQSQNFWNTVKTEGQWFSLQPVKIQLNGDTAVVYFYASSGRVEDGKATATEQMRVETFRKIDGKWHTLGGMRAEVK